MSNILQVPVPFFFEGAPHVSGQHKGTDEAPSPGYVSEFISSSDGLVVKVIRLSPAEMPVY